MTGMGWLMTVKQKQCILAFFDCLGAAGIDGIWGKQSAAATEKLQRRLGLSPSGIWDAQTEQGALDRLGEEEDSFWDHIRYWTREEFRCQCGGKYCDGFPAEPDRVLVELVDDLRHRLGAPGHRSSGLRCPIHNANEGGVRNSRHLTGKALDFMVEGKTGQQLLDAAQADQRTRYAYIIGKGPYVHVDVA